MTKLNATAVSNDQLFEMIKKLQAENEALKAGPKAREAKVSCKVGEKGGLCINVGRRYPIHMFIQEWDLIKANMKTIDDFVAKNRAQFSTKG